MVVDAEIEAADGSWGGRVLLLLDAADLGLRRAACLGKRATVAATLLDREWAADE